MNESILQNVETAHRVANSENRTYNKKCIGRDLGLIKFLGRLLLLLSLLVSAQDSFATVDSVLDRDGKPPIVVKIGKSITITIHTNSYVIDYVTPKYRIKDDIVKRSDLTMPVNTASARVLSLNTGGDYLFSHLEFDDDYLKLDSVGYPEFPYKQLELLMPPCFANVDVKVSNVVTRKILFDKKYMPSLFISPSENIYSLQLSPFYTESMPTATNGIIFGNENLIAEQSDNVSLPTKDAHSCWYKVTEPYGFVGTKGISLSIYPLNYNPMEIYSDILEKATFTVTFSRINFECSRIHVKELKELIMEYLQGNHYQGIMDYYDSFRGLNYKIKSPDKGNYMIITLSKYKEALKEFITYKKSIGYNVTVWGFAETVGISKNREQLRAFIRGLYLQPQYSPRFLLLVGNPQELTYSAGSPLDTDDPPTDLYYSCMEYSTISEERKHNLNPDIYVGRWNVNGEEEVKNIAKKTIKTESALYNTSNYTREVIMFSGTGSCMENNWFWGDIKLIREKIDKVWLPTVMYDGRESNKNDMISELTTVIDNKNPFMFIYSGHGGNKSLGDPYNLYYWDMNANKGLVQNSWLRCQPFGFAMACSTNDYSEIDNFAKGFTSASMNGGVTFFGSTVSTYPLPDRISFLSIFGKLRTKTNYHIADLTSWGMGSYYSGLKICARRRQVEKYNLIGDPSLRIYGVSITDGNVGSYTPPYKYNTPKQEVADKYGGEVTAKMITISPTIAKDIITVSATSDIRIRSITIKDLMGRDIKYVETGVNNVNISDIQNGIYFVTILYDNNQMYIEKVIINH